MGLIRRTARVGEVDIYSVYLFSACGLYSYAWLKTTTKQRHSGSVGTSQRDRRILLGNSGLGMTGTVELQGKAHLPGACDGGAWMTKRGRERSQTTCPVKLHHNRQQRGRQSNVAQKDAGQIFKPLYHWVESRAEQRTDMLLW